MLGAGGRSPRQVFSSNPPSWRASLCPRRPEGRWRCCLPKKGAAGEQRTDGQFGLELRADLREDAWWQEGEQLASEQAASSWKIGDWLLFAERHYDEGKRNDNRYTKAEKVTGLAYQTLRNRASVARKFDLSRRRDTLTFEHHAAVAKLKEDEQDKWLGKAERQGWSVKDLRRKLSEAKPRRNETSRTIRLRFEGDRLLAVYADVEELAADQQLAIEAFCMHAVEHEVERKKPEQGLHVAPTAEPKARKAA
jgi:hypothetical protein